jgi:hypothetical protein
VLVPLGFLQIFLNGLVLVYEWPDGLLLPFSAAGLALAAYIVYRSVRVEPRALQFVHHPATASPPPPAPVAQAPAESG